MTDGRIAQPSDYGEPYIVTRRLIEDGRENLVLRAPLPMPWPVRLLQGTEDEGGRTIRRAGASRPHRRSDVRLTLVKGADHRFSLVRLLALLDATLDG